MMKAHLGMGAKVRLATVAVSMTLLGSLPATGTNLFWSANGTSQGGAGTWNTTVAHWDTTNTGPFLTIWNNANADSAEFGGTAGQVNFGGALTVDTITTDVSGFLLGNGNGVSTTPVTTGAGAGGALTINTNHSAGSTTTWQGITTSPIIKTGTGRLGLDNSQTTNPQYSTITINQGSISLAAANRLGLAPVSLIPNFFTFNGGGLTSSNAAVQDLGATRGWTIQAGGAFLGASAATNPVTVSAPVTGTGDITVTNAGPFASPVNTGGNWTFSNTGNNWVGNLIVGGSSGSGVKLGASGVIPDTTVVSTTVAGNTFDLNGFDETIRGIASSAGTILTGAKTLTLNDSTGQIQTAGVVNVGAGGKLVKSGTGAQTLKGSNVNNGEIILDGGTLGVGGTNSLGTAGNTGVVTINGGILSNDGTGGRSIPSSIAANLNGDFTVDDSLFNSSTPGQILFNGSVTLKNSDRTITVNGLANLGLGGVVGDEGAGRGIIKNGNGALALPNAANTYSGNTTINAGAINLDGDGTLGNGAGNLILNGGALNATASRSGTGSIVLNPVQLITSSSITCSSTAVTPIFEFSGALTGTAGQVLTFRDDAAAATQFKPRFSGVFTFDGDINMPTGSGAAAAVVQFESFNTTGTTQTFTGTISGTGSYNRSASSAGTGGTTVFTGSNSYSGGTSVTRGTLLANNTSGSATGSGAVSVGSNGTLGGKGSVDGLVTVSNFGIVAPGNPGVNNGIDTLTLKGGLTVLEGGNLNFDLGAPGTGDKIDLLTSTLILPATNLPSTAFVNLTDAGGLAVGTYTLIDYGTNDPGGSLSNVAVVGPGGFNYSLFDNTGASAIELHVMAVAAGLPGDFNNDSKVDASDYVTWRTNEVPNASLPNDGGAADQSARYTLWRSNFGNPPGAGSGGGLGGSAVPEPSAIVLLVMGLLAVAFRRRG